MRLDCNTNDAEVMSMVNKVSSADFIDTKQLDWVDSGMYACEIDSAFISTFTDQNTGLTKESVACTCVAYSKNNEVLGKFKVSFSLDPNDTKAKSWIMQLLVVTDNRNGCDETPVTRKDGSVVNDFNDQPLRQYKDLCHKRIYMGIIRGEDKIGNNGEVYAKYAKWYIYNANKQNTREILNNLPAQQIIKDNAYLLKKIQEAEEQKAEMDKMLNSTSISSGIGNASAPTPKPSPYTQKQPVYKEPTPPQNSELDDLPF